MAWQLTSLPDDTYQWVDDRTGATAPYDSNTGEPPPPIAQSPVAPPPPQAPAGPVYSDWATSHGLTQFEDYLGQSKSFSPQMVNYLQQMSSVAPQYDASGNLTNGSQMWSDYVTRVQDRESGGNKNDVVPESIANAISNFVSDPASLLAAATTGQLGGMTGAEALTGGDIGTGVTTDLAALASAATGAGVGSLGAGSTLSGAAAGGAGGLVQSGGDLDAALKGAVVGGAGGAIFGPADTLQEQSALAQQGLEGAGELSEVPALSPELPSQPPLELAPAPVEPPAFSPPSVAQAPVEPPAFSQPPQVSPEQPAPSIADAFNTQLATMEPTPSFEPPPSVAQTYPVAEPAQIESVPLAPEPPPQVQVAPPPPPQPPQQVAPPASIADAFDTQLSAPTEIESAQPPQVEPPPQVASSFEPPQVAPEPQVAPPLAQTPPPASIADALNTQLASNDIGTQTDVTAPTIGGGDLGSGLLPSTAPTVPGMGAQGITPPADTFPVQEFTTPELPPLADAGDALGTGLTTPLLPEGQGLGLPSSPALPDMGGAAGVTAPTGSVIGDAGSLVNNLDVLNASAPGTVGATGTTFPGTTPPLGDPNSFINQGTFNAPPPASVSGTTPPAPQAAVVDEQQQPEQQQPPVQPQPVVDQQPPAPTENPPQATDGGGSIDIGEIGKTIKDNLLPIAAGGSIIAALNPPEIPPDPNEAARAAEQERLARAALARGKVEDAFGQYDDDYYGSISKNFMDHYAPDLNEQYDDLARKALYAAPGGVGSSEFARQLGKIEKTRLEDLSDLSGRATGASNDVRDALATQKTNLLSQADAAQDPEAFGNQAVSMAQAAARPAPYSPIADLFSRFTALAANTAIANAQPAIQGTGGGGYYPQRELLFNSGGGGSGGNDTNSSVRVIR